MKYSSSNPVSFFTDAKTGAETADQVLTSKTEQD